MKKCKPEKGVNRRRRWAGAALAALLAALFFAQGWAVPARALDTETMLTMQRRLIAMGLLTGRPDGLEGEKTVFALERLQAHAASIGLALDGQALIDALLAGQIPAEGATAREGDVSEMAMRVQNRLRALGYLSGAADGRYGAATARAVKVFQFDHALEPTGEADQATQRTLFSIDAAMAEWPILTNGAHNERVRALQTRLTTLGFMTGVLDGQYGANTVQGVKAFQTFLSSSPAYQELDARLTNTGINGVADPLIQRLLYAEDFPSVQAGLQEGDSGQDVYRLQRRLIALGYLDTAPDGGYGPQTKEAVEAFQKRASIKVNGVANEKTVELLFAETALEAVKPFKLVISISEQKLFVYSAGADGAYAKLTYTMRCSTGPDVEAGRYQETVLPAAKQWAQLKAGETVRYPFQLASGLMIHSVPYDAARKQIDSASLSALGTPQGIGGITLSVENAKLIYDKCPVRTPVEIVE